MVERRPKKTAVYHISKHLVQAGTRGWKALEVMSSPKKEKNIQRLCDILDDNERNLTDLIESLEVN